MKKNILEYKGYIGSVDFSPDDRVFHGKILGVKDMILFEGSTVDELEKNFHSAVENYLNDCLKYNKEPEKPFSGKFLLRISPELHGNIAAKAKQEKKSINSWVGEVCRKAVLS